MIHIHAYIQNLLLCTMQCKPFVNFIMHVAVCLLPFVPSCRQIIGETAGEVIAVADMHQRKAEMERQSDAFIALPGEY